MQFSQLQALYKLRVALELRGLARSFCGMSELLLAIWCLQRYLPKGSDWRQRFIRGRICAGVLRQLWS